MPCEGSSNACPMDVVSAPWHAKPTGEGTRLSPQQFHSSTGHDQPSVPAGLICTLYLGCCLNVCWLFEIRAECICLSKKNIGVCVCVCVRARACVSV